MKTQNEILIKIRGLIYERNLFTDTQVNDLVCHLEYEHAKEFIKDSCTKESWTADKAIYTKKNLMKEIECYMNFAWSKANDRRGLSAERSLQHMFAWTFLLDDGFYEKLFISYVEGYEFYGKPQLVLICENYGIDWKKLDDDKWSNSEEDDPEFTAQEAMKTLGIED